MLAVHPVKNQPELSPDKLALWQKKNYYCGKNDCAKYSDLETIAL